MVGGGKLNDSKNAVKSVAIIVAFTLISKIMGFIREAIIAAEFGSGELTDTFFVSLTAISLFTIMLTQAINNTLIPVLTEIESQEGKKAKLISASNILNFVILGTILFTFLGWIISPLLIRVMAVGFEGSQFDLAVKLMRIGLPSLIFAGIVGVLRGLLQSESKFAESAVSQIPFNLVYIFYLLVLAEPFGIIGLMFASVVAVASQILAQLPGLKKIKYKHKKHINIKEKYIEKIVKLVPPVILSVAINDVNKIIDKSLASTLVAGSVSALNYANRLKDLILGVFVTAVVTVIYPMLSVEANSTSKENYKKVISKGINIIIIITVPATLGMIALSTPITSLVFERGSFDSFATNMTSVALVFYCVGLPTMSLRIFLDKVFYSIQDTKTPMINGFIAVAINIVLNFMLIKFLGHGGLALATSISSAITSVLLIYKLRQKIGALGLKRNAVTTVKVFVASLFMAIGTKYLYDYLINSFGINNISSALILILTVIISSVVYIILINIMKIEEFTWFLQLIRRKLKR